MMLEIPSAIMGGIIGALLTGFAFAMTTSKELVAINVRLSNVEEQIDGLGSFTPRKLTRSDPNG